MDAVELYLPTAAVTAAKVMGSDGFGGGAGVTVKEVKARESDRVSIVVGPSIDRCSSFLSRKDEAVSASEPGFWRKMPDAEIRSFNGESMSDDFNCRSTNSSPLLMSEPETKQLKRKYTKVARSSSGCTKKSRMAPVEVSIHENGADDSKEKTQMAKQKNHLYGKRGDKRNGKVPMKSKYDSFSFKAGLLSFSSSAGGNNIIGVSGSKSDINDVTKNVDDLSLNDLLDGSYKCPSFVKDSGKKAASLNGNLLSSVAKAFSMLRPRKPLRPQNFSEIDITCNRKVSTSIASSGSSVVGRSDGDKVETFTTVGSSCNKDAYRQLETPTCMLESTLNDPLDVLERLSLPPPKDLDSLLLDAMKPVLSSRSNPDLRSPKPVAHRAGLPPFPWSHTSSANCKSNSDAVKLSTSRSTCQARWVKIGNTIASSSVGATTSGFLADFESLTFDQRLVPSVSVKSGPSEPQNVPSTSTSFPSPKRGSSSSAIISLASRVHAESGGSLKSQVKAEHSPTLLAAAQTLYDIATKSLKQNQQEAIKWPKKPSQKAMKARKSKLEEKSEEVSAAVKSPRGPDNNLIKNADEALPFKKPRLPVNEKNDSNFNYSNSRKGPLTWSSSKSSRSSPSKSLKDSVSETKQHNPNIVKQSCIISPPPPRVVDRERNSPQKMRKLMPIEWNRAGAKME